MWLDCSIECDRRCCRIPWHSKLRRDGVMQPQIMAALCRPVLVRHADRTSWSPMTQHYRSAAITVMTMQGCVHLAKLGATCSHHTHRHTLTHTQRLSTCMQVPSTCIQTLLTHMQNTVDTHANDLNTHANALTKHAPQLTSLQLPCC